MSRLGTAVARTFGILGLLVLMVPFGASAGQRATPYHELDPDPKLLATTPGLEAPELGELLDRLERRGFVVPLAFVGAGVVVLDAPGVEEALRAEPAVKSVRRHPVLTSARPGASRDRRTAGMLRWWNAGFSVPGLGADARATISEVRICAGAFTEETNPAARDQPCHAGTYGSPGKIHYAAGRIVVNLVLPKHETATTWSPQKQEIATSELARALNWWSLKSGREASFVIQDWGPAATRYEPAELSMDAEDLYIGDCLGSLPVDFDSDCAYTMVGELNQISRDALRAHWACTQFILDANAFPGSGALAYAYLGGPHTVALFENGPLTSEELDRVIAHELGHIFQAADEYASGCTGCGGAWGYFRTPNGNCDNEICTGQVGRCVMRGAGEYSEYEMHQMEITMDPCRWTKEMAGLRDLDGNGILDVRETTPETMFTSALPETLQSSQGLSVFGKTWDLPYPSPPDYAEEVTVNSIVGAQFSVSGEGWNSAEPLDGDWTSADGGFELLLPPLGGGPHTLAVRGVNTVGAEDPTPAHRDFFVYDVILREDLEIVPGLVHGPDGGPRRPGFELEWQVDGEDFDSEYRLYRSRANGTEELLATIRSPGGRHPRFRYEDTTVQPGVDYVYQLDVHIPGKDPKLLSRTSAASSPSQDSRLVAMAPNPFRDAMLVSVRVPGGPGEGWRVTDVRIYDVRGTLVRSLGALRESEAKRFDVEWDGRTDRGEPTPPGVYFVRVDFGSRSETNRVIRLR
jgi:hypothetical protein